MRIRSGLLAALSVSCLAVPLAGQQHQSIILATTTSTQDSGLLDSLVPRFEQESGIGVKVIAVGTGAALEMARRGDADVVLVHAPELEREYAGRRDILEGRFIMHNDFVLLGPPADPAGARACNALACALRAIARAGWFISRGDRSGTHQKELQLWALAAIAPETLSRRQETGQGMGATLDVAVQKQAYTLSDRGTWLAHRAGRDLVIVAEGDPLLRNEYRAYLVNPERHPGVKVDPGRRFLAYLVSPEAQAVIARFGVERFGQPLFVPDAE